MSKRRLTRRSLVDGCIEEDRRRTGRMIAGLLICSRCPPGLAQLFLSLFLPNRSAAEPGSAPGYTGFRSQAGKRLDGCSSQFAAKEGAQCGTELGGLHRAHRPWFERESTCTSLESFAAQYRTYWSITVQLLCSVL